MPLTEVQASRHVDVSRNARVFRGRSLCGRPLGAHGADLNGSRRVYRSSSHVRAGSTAVRHFEGAHLAIEIRPLDAERPGRRSDAAAMLPQDRGDVLLLELCARLTQGAAL